VRRRDLLGLLGGAVDVLHLLVRMRLGRFHRQLRLPAREVEVHRAPGGAAALEDIGDRGRVIPPLADELPGGLHHPLLGI